MIYGKNDLNIDVEQAGFSLAEVLVTISVLVVIGIFVTLALTGTFQGNTKTDLISTIKLNGQNALSQMEKDIRDAETVICPQTTTPTATPVSVIAVRSKTEGTVIRYAYFPQNGTTTNGYLQKEVFVFPSIPVDVTFYTDMCNTSYTTNQKSKLDLTDKDSQSAVSVKNTAQRGFWVEKKAGSKDLVTVQFDLGPSVTSGTNFEENVGTGNSFSFKTTIQLR